MVRYRQADLVPEEVKKELQYFDSLSQQLLFTHDILNTQDASEFLNPSYDKHLHDPFLLHDMEKAVERILFAIANNERIAIFSDYDCDGIPGAVVLHDFFKKIGFENFTNYIPHRHYEGFGLSIDAVKKLHTDKVQLIITIDCGTCNIEAVDEANKLNIDVIITDHHLPKKKLPVAHSIVNPVIGESYPNKGLCGAGVVYKLVQALIERGTSRKQFELPTGWEKWLLDMVGIATVADMVPLTGENRALARYGLTVLRKSRRPGIQQLLQKQRASQQHLTEDDIGFTIGPRINAASRMDTPEDAFYMMASQDIKEAGAHVEHLEKLNNERKGIVSAMTKDIHKRMKDIVEIPTVLVMGNPEWRPSLVGLTANKLAGEYNCPVFLWGRDGNGVIKGSCRSEGVTSVVSLMDATAEQFVEYGGHHMSGGFSVTDEAIHTLSSTLNDTFVKLGNKVAIDEPILIDAVIKLDDIDKTVFKMLAMFAPFGIGNHKPLFAFEKITPVSVIFFGKGQEHTKLIFETKGLANEAIAFFKLPTNFVKEPKANEECTLLGHIEQSFFFGRLQTRIRIVDII